MSQTCSQIRTLIVADIKLYCEGLSVVLDQTEHISVVGTASDRLQALDMVTSNAPDVVLLDMAMPEGSEIVAAIVRNDHNVHVVALAVPEIDTQILACAEAGVSGFVSRDASINDLVDTIQATVRGELNCSRRLAGSLFRRVGWLATQQPTNEQAVQLTSREMEIAELIDRGLSNKEIAKTLWIEVSTVKNHVHSILAKLNVRRRGEAAALLRPLLVRRVGRSKV